MIIVFSARSVVTAPPKIATPRVIPYANLRCMVKNFVFYFGAGKQGTTVENVFLSGAVDSLLIH